MPEVSAVDQIKNGVTVKCADGAVITVRPLMLGEVMDLLKIADMIELCAQFVTIYPELRDHIAGGDVTTLLAGFYLTASGATVVLPQTPGDPTGTAPSAPTSPAGASSPT